MKEKAPGGGQSNGIQIARSESVFTELPITITHVIDIDVRITTSVITEGEMFVIGGAEAPGDNTTCSVMFAEGSESCHELINELHRKKNPPKGELWFKKMHRKTHSMHQVTRVCHACL